MARSGSFVKTEKQFKMRSTEKNATTYHLRILVIVVFIVIIAFMASLITSSAVQEGQSRTFLTQFVVAGGPIVWFILLPMSIATVYLGIELCFSIRRKVLLPFGIASRIINITRQFGIASVPARIDDNVDFISKALLRTILKSQYLCDDPKYIQHLAAESLQEQAIHILRKVEWCSTIGNVAPMVGLFGTVFGMIKAFNILGVSGGQPRPDQLAGAISVALVTTFWGLLIAIPALTLHGVFRARVEGIVGEAAIELETLLRQIISFAKHPNVTVQKTNLDTPYPVEESVQDKEISGNSDTFSAKLS